MGRYDVPDLRIVDDDLWGAVRAEFQKRSRPVSASHSPVVYRRRKHLLLGTIKCASCGSYFTIPGKDYYRCAGARERGTCPNTLSLRRDTIESAVLSVLEDNFLEPDLAEMFVTEFSKELARRAEGAESQGVQTAQRLVEVNQQIVMLSRNMLVSEASPSLHKMLTELEQGKARLEAVTLSHQ